MTSRALVLLACAALAGCPLPQPLPDYPPGTITPPRVQSDGVEANRSAVRLVPAGCAISPEYELSAEIYDTLGLPVEARWFVNYDAESRFTPIQDDSIPPNSEPTEFIRMVPPRGPLVFRPYLHPPPVGAPPFIGPPYPDAGILRVVEMVVATNGFDSSASSPPVPLPRRTPLPGNETQVYRWVFLSVPPSADVPCP
jgi:hypothetical protein